MNKSWPFIAAGAVALFYISKASAVTKLRYYVDGVSAAIVNGYPVITLNIAIQNPTNEQFTINSVIGTLTSNGLPIGRVESNAQVVVKPAGQSSYPINVRVVLQGLSLTIFNLITQGIGTSQNIGFEGAVNASGVVVPLDLMLTIA